MVRRRRSGGVENSRLSFSGCLWQKTLGGGLVDKKFQIDDRFGQEWHPGVYSQYS